MRRAALALCVVFGCSDDDGTLPRGLVEVTVLRGEARIANAPVVFHDARGHVLSMATTDERGVASGEIIGAGRVTVADPDRAMLVTITSVDVGASLEVPLNNRAAAPATGSLAIDAAVTPPPPETAELDIQTPCGSKVVPSLPTALALHDGCRGDVPVLITARTENRNLEDPGRALAHSIGLTNGDRFQPQTWSSTCAQLVIEGDIGMEIQVWPRLAGHAFRWVDLGYCPPASSTPGARTFPTLDFGDGGVVVGSGSVAGDLRSTIVLADAPSLLDTLSLSSERDTLFGDAELVSHDVDGARWSQDAALESADAIVASVTWSVADQRYVHWQFVLAPGATSAIRPELPDELLPWSSLDDVEAVGVELRHVEASWIDTYTGVQAHLPLLMEGALSTRLMPSRGRLRYYVERFYPDA